MKEGDGSQHDWQLDNFYPSGREGVEIVGGERNVATTKIIVRIREVNAISFQLILSGGTTNPPIGESRGNLNAIHELVHDGPEAFRGIGCSRAMQRKDRRTVIGSMIRQSLRQYCH